MSDAQRLEAVFREVLEADPAEDVTTFEYRVANGWDSVAHMALVAGIEDEFDIMLDTDQVIDMSSFGRALEIVTEQVAHVG